MERLRRVDSRCAHRSGRRALQPRPPSSWCGTPTAPRRRLRSRRSPPPITRRIPTRHVSTLAVPYDAFADKISAAVPRGKGPDVFIYAQDRLGGWIEAGNTVEPIDFFIDKDTKDRFIPTTMEAMDLQRNGLRAAAQLTSASRSSTTRSWSPIRPKDSDELVTVAKKKHRQGGGAVRSRVRVQRLLLPCSPAERVLAGTSSRAGAKPAINNPNNAKGPRVPPQVLTRDQIPAGGAFHRTDHRAVQRRARPR